MTPKGVEHSITLNWRTIEKSLPNLSMTPKGVEHPATRLSVTERAKPELIYDAERR